MKTYILFTTTFIVLLLCWGCKDDDDPTGPTEVASGSVSGKWECALSPYMINGDIWIEDGEVLIIEPCVEVVFTGHYRFDIGGQLLAEGTENSNILFTAESREVGWNGLRFDEISVSNDSSKLINCKIQYGKPTGTTTNDKSGGGIFIHSVDKILVSHCEISENKTDGDIYSGGAGLVIINSSPTITNNIFSLNEAQGEGHGGGIGITNSSNPIVTNNLIYHNSAYGGGGVVVFNCDPVLINNTIAGNYADHGGGIDILTGSPTFINTIIYGNLATSFGNQVNFFDQNTSNFTSNFLYCDIEEGYHSFTFIPNPPASYPGRYENNIDVDPAFVNNFEDFNLVSSSPCIGAGINMIEVDGIIYHVPSTDYYGNPRPAPSGSSSDIGAIEYGN